MLQLSEFLHIGPPGAAIRFNCNSKAVFAANALAVLTNGALNPVFTDCSLTSMFFHHPKRKRTVQNTHAIPNEL